MYINPLKGIFTMSFCAASERYLLKPVLHLSLIGVLFFLTSLPDIAESERKGLRVNTDLSQKGLTLIPEEGNATVKLIANQGECFISGMSMLTGLDYCRIAIYW